MNTIFLFTLIFHILLFITLTLPSSTASSGSWQILHNSIGIPAMHMQLLHTDHVVMFDRTDFGLSNLSLPNGMCRHFKNGNVSRTDCTAHAIEYDVASNKVRGLFLQSEVWCSSASVMADGMLVQTGGFNEGERKVRTYIPCSNSSCEWKEIDGGLNVKRWYSTNHALPDGRQIIIGGQGQFNYEFFPKSSNDKDTYSLPFLVETYDKFVQNNLYPFVFLNLDGNLFIFANNRAILFNYKNNTVVRIYPTIPDGGNPRCYPSTGSAVMLPLKNLESKNIEAEVLICGGAPIGSWQQTREGQFWEALRTCARIKITDPNAMWKMEDMPRGRVMNDMVMLPNGNVLIINGAALGTAGWEQAVNPVLNPFLYKPENENGSRFEVLNPTTIPRMYHSSTVLLRDGRVIVGGSNPHQYYEYKTSFYPTELSLEAFSPPYLDPMFAPLRPKILEPSSQANLTYGKYFRMSFQVNGTLVTDSVYVTMLAPPFNTHSFSMNQRLLVLTTTEVNTTGNSTYEFNVRTPISSVLAPLGFYIIFVVHQEIPSEGIWIRISD
ncbi:hypothetical protein Lal_00004696 [Lupinus albus]|uniref:Putative galactose oxidase n=1 Tax=Lupinus albus TaxID=3870 RepID=A0A6A5M3G2_LUPAL|nr:putative galactose oxidase [Lupinus albus]KAF1865322.1 hypothetical protein Lal_00004696 [Lupinus albus]